MTINQSKSIHIFLDSHEFYHAAIQIIWNIIYSLDNNTQIGVEICRLNSNSILTPSSVILDITQHQLAAILIEMCRVYNDPDDELEEDYISHRFSAELDDLDYCIEMLLLLYANRDTVDTAIDKIKNELFKTFSTMIIQYVLNTLDIPHNTSSIELAVITGEYFLPIVNYQYALHGFIMELNYPVISAKHNSTEVVW